MNHRKYHTNVAASALAIYQNDYDRAIALIEKHLPMQRLLGDQRSVANALNELGMIYVALGDSARAYACYKECLDIRRSLDDQPGIAVALMNLGSLAQYGKDFGLADTLLHESLAIQRALGNEILIAGAMTNSFQDATGDTAEYLWAYRLFNSSPRRLKL